DHRPAGRRLRGRAARPGRGRGGYAGPDHGVAAGALPPGPGGHRRAPRGGAGRAARAERTAAPRPGAASHPPERARERWAPHRRLGADVPKIAVTPRSARDVLTLLSASLTVAEDLSGPHIAISMGTLGASTRVAAETFGSAATFATAGEGSAPGQLRAEDVAG